MTGGGGGTSTGGTERVPWNELANLIQDNFDVTHSEASELADNALESDWTDPNRSRSIDTDTDRDSAGGSE